MPERGANRNRLIDIQTGQSWWLIARRSVREQHAVRTLLEPTSDLGIRGRELVQEGSRSLGARAQAFAGCDCGERLADSVAIPIDAAIGGSRQIRIQPTEELDRVYIQAAILVFRSD